jgi:PD-(D/E)XK nuclease superfamily protein
LSSDASPLRITRVALNRKGKGDLAELKVATDLVARGYKVAFPYGEDWDYDLVLCRGERLERVQVKYSRSDGAVVPVRCRSHSLTNGKVRATKRYTAKTIDWLAVYDATTERCFYIPAVVLGCGRNHFYLRLLPTRNGQVKGTHPAARYSDI